MKQKELHHLQKKKKKQKGDPGVTKRETLCYLRNFVMNRVGDKCYTTYFLRRYVRTWYQGKLEI